MNNLLRTSIMTAILGVSLTLITVCSKSPDNAKTDQQTSSSAQTSTPSDPSNNTNQENTSEEDSSNEESNSTSSTSSTLPEFSVKTIDNKNISSEDLLGKVTVINFWGTWCPPCVKEIPHFQKTYENLKDKGFTVLGVAVPQGGRGTIGDVKSFIKENGMTYPNVMFESMPMNRIQQAFGRVSGLPTTFVLDRSGNLQKSFIGYTSKEKLKNAVDPLINK